MIRELARNLYEIAKNNNGRMPKSMLQTVVTDKKFYDTYEILKTIEPQFVDDKISINKIIEKYKDTDQYYAILASYYMYPHQIPEIRGLDTIKLGPFVPKVMLAIREQTNLGYNSWKRDDKYMKYALGRTLEHLKYIKPNVKASKEQILAWREAFRYEGDNMHALKNARTKEGLEFKETWGIPINPLHNQGINSAVPCIILQWWQAHATKRVPDRMILDVYDWESTPEAIDYVSLPMGENSSKEIPSVSDDLLPF